MNTIELLTGNSSAFPILSRMDFFNHAGVSPIPHVAAEAFRAYASQAESAAYCGASWYKDLERLRELAAELIHASADEIAFIKNTSEGIATVANAVDWRPGDRVVSTGVEYPANMYPWMDVAQRFGVELVTVQEEDAVDGRRAVPLERILQEARHPRTKLVALSHVEFASGQRHDVATIGGFCRGNGKLLSVDAIQSMGVLPLDVRSMNIDFLAADGHKWMLGPEGAGILYCRRELLARMHPLIVGWMNVVNAEDFGHYNFTLRPDGRRFESGSHNVPGFMALKASLELLASAGINAVAARVRSLTDGLIGGLQARGYRVVSPRASEAWSGIVSFTSPRHDEADIFRALRAEKIEVALRVGRLRASPHFYNTGEQMERLVSHLP